MMLKELLTRVEERRLPKPEVRRQIRQDAGLTQSELAQHLGVSRGALARWEAGTRTPRSELRRSYAAALRLLSEGAR